MKEINRNGYAENSEECYVFWAFPQFLSGNPEIILRTLDSRSTDLGNDNTKPSGES